jgi:hypothetical protein
MRQQEGFRPAGRQSKRGRCTLCGKTATLTKAHVPPKAAFNEGEFAWGGTTSNSVLSYGRAQLGGANRYAHCQSCRALTSPWDDEYIRWAHCFAGHLVRSPRKGERTHINGQLTGVRPGRFIRAALAGMTALTPRLIDTHPVTVRIVREGIAADPPEPIRFLMGITPSQTRAHIEGSHGAQVVSMTRGSKRDGWTAGTTPALSAVLHFPPFSLLLADRQLVDSYPHVNCTEFLKLDVDEVADVALTLPIVDLATTSASPIPISMLRFREALA